VVRRKLDVGSITIKLLCRGPQILELVVASEDDDAWLPCDDIAMGLHLDWIAISECENKRNRWDFVNFNIVKQDNIAITTVKPFASVVVRI
jgi:hypothetical protein